MAVTHNFTRGLSARLQSLGIAEVRMQAIHVEQNSDNLVYREI